MFEVNLCNMRPLSPKHSFDQPSNPPTYPPQAKVKLATTKKIGRMFTKLPEGISMMLTCLVKNQLYPSTVVVKVAKAK